MLKIKEGFILRSVSEAYVVVATGEASKDFNGMITLNETGAFLWEKLAEGCENAAALVDKLLEEYDVSKELAQKDVNTFIEKLTASKLLQD